jgi:uncharacterized protein YfdQ (DUF2303 family)
VAENKSNNWDVETIQEITKLARAGMVPTLLPGTKVPVVMVPSGCTVQAMPELVFNDYEPHEIQPKRIKGTVSVLDAESFVKYFGDYRNDESRVFAYEPSSEVVGVIDYHEAAGSKPHWCEHRVALTLRWSEPWQAWTANNNKRMSQVKFAEYLEQNALDIFSPSPASIMDVARDMQATSEVEFSGGARANGSMNFRYTEQTRATVGAAQLSVPERFTIQIPCYVGGFPVPMEVLLRFRVKEGHLEIWFTLVRPDEVARQAFIGTRQQIAVMLDIQIINGKGV